MPPAKRTKFSAEEEENMWRFFVGKLQKRDIDACKLDSKIWIEYRNKREQTGFNSRHTIDTVAKHFSRHMLSKIVEAPITNDEIFEVLACCPLSFLRRNSAELRSLERRLKCNLKLDNFDYVHKVTDPNDLNEYYAFFSGQPNARPSDECASASTSKDTPPSILQSNNEQDETTSTRSKSKHTDNSNPIPTTVANLPTETANISINEEDSVCDTSELSFTLNINGVGDEEDLALNRSILKELQPICFDEVERMNTEDRAGVSSTAVASPSTTFVAPNRNTGVNCDSQLQPQLFSFEGGLSQDDLTAILLDAENGGTNTGRSEKEMVTDSFTINNMNLLGDVRIDATSCALTEELQAELLYYQTLCVMNENNLGVSPREVLELKELIRLRAKLIIQKVLPVEEFFKNIPAFFQNKLGEFAKLLKWSISVEETSLSKTCV